MHLEACFCYSCVAAGNYEIGEGGSLLWFPKSWDEIKADFPCLLTVWHDWLHEPANEHYALWDEILSMQVGVFGVLDN
jgi:hypothetical protein